MKSLENENLGVAAVYFGNSDGFVTVDQFIRCLHNFINILCVRLCIFWDPIKKFYSSLCSRIIEGQYTILYFGSSTLQ